MLKYDKNKGCCNVPYSVNISVTEKCPMQCPFCFHKYGQKQEMSYETAKRFINELSKMGVAQVQFSGGEPLVYPHIEEVIEYAHSKGMHTVISSSGMGITEGKVLNLKKAGLDCCYISVNGSKREIHELTRDNFSCAIYALKILSKNGQRTAINWVAYHENIDDLPDLVSLAKSFNVNHISAIPMKLNCENKIMASCITMNDYNKLKQYCNIFKNFLILDSCFGEFEEISKRNNRFAYGCRAGQYYMAINVSGEFTPCPHLTGKKAEQKSIMKYWNENEDLIQYRKNKKCHCVIIPER